MLIGRLFIPCGDDSKNTFVLILVNIISSYFVLADFFFLFCFDGCDRCGGDFAAKSPSLFATIILLLLLYYD